MLPMAHSTPRDAHPLPPSPGNPQGFNEEPWGSSSMRAGRRGCLGQALRGLRAGCFGRSLILGAEGCWEHGVTACSPSCQPDASVGSARAEWSPWGGDIFGG